MKPGPFLTRPLLDAAMVITVRRAVRKFKPDVVHAHNYEGLAVAIAARAPNLVYHAHNLMAEELPHYIPGTGLLGRFADHVLPRMATRVIVPHAKLADWMLAHGHSARNIYTIPPPIQLPDIAPNHKGSPGIASVLYIGNRDRYQNLGFLRRVAHRLHAEHPEINFMAGTPDGISPGAPFVGHRMDSYESMCGLLARDVVVACPRVSWSGYPIKLLNAMAAERAIVASEACAFPVRDKWNGMIVRDGDEKAFADTLLQVASDAKLRYSLGVFGRITIGTMHDPPHVARMMEEVYSGLHQT
jgi:glycosyltransferase involved in cell wall biosynthesis